MYIRTCTRTHIRFMDRASLVVVPCGSLELCEEPTKRPRTSGPGHCAAGSRAGQGRRSSTGAPPARQAGEAGHVDRGVPPHAWYALAVPDRRPRAEHQHDKPEKPGTWCPRTHGSGTGPTTKGRTPARQAGDAGHVVSPHAVLRRERTLILVCPSACKRQCCTRAKKGSLCESLLHSCYL